MGGSRNKNSTVQKNKLIDNYSNQDYRDNDSGDEVDHASSIKLRNKLPPLGQEHNLMPNLMNVVDEKGYASNNNRSAAAAGESENMLDQRSSMQQQLMSPDELRFDHSLDSNEWVENLQNQNNAISVASVTRKSNKSAKNKQASNGYIQQQINMQIQQNNSLENSSTPHSYLRDYCDDSSPAFDLSKRKKVNASSSDYQNRGSGSPKKEFSDYG